MNEKTQSTNVNTKMNLILELAKNIKKMLQQSFAHSSETNEGKKLSTKKEVFKR